MLLRCALFFILFCLVLTTSITAQTSGPSLTINAVTNLHPISPYIYGSNFADETFAAEIALPVNRWGGNATTRYNWQTDTANHAMDWYFENIVKDTASPNLPDDSAFDLFVEQNIRTGTETLMVIPMIGWTPKPQATRVVCGFSVAKYGAQQSTDPWHPDCGNGRHPNGSVMTGNDPTDTSMVIDEQFVQDWMAHLSKYGGVRFYNLDNEPSLWNDTHRDVHPEPLSYDGLRDLTYQYARAIKDVDANAQVLGPVEYGWTAYFYSALDWEAGGAWWENPIDRNAHGGTPLVEWYLQQMKDYEDTHGIRILDYLDLHYYPAAPGVTLNTAGGAARQALRLRSTRSLWDTTYPDESWIGTDVGEAVYLIPRMQGWIDTHYPGTKIAITEYNWGGLEHINGALAQADVLGIFGREGVGLANLWDGPTPAQPGAYAFRIYRNYDGEGSQFGETSVQAVSGNQEQLSVYAALRDGDGALTLVIINKSTSDLTSTVTINQFDAAPIAQAYRYSTANLNAIVPLADQTLSGNAFTMTFPVNSITLVEIADGSTVSQVDLLVDGGFEEPFAAHWKGNNLTEDKRMCNKTGKPAVARTGECAFKFTGSNVLSTIVQKIIAPSIQPGDLLVLSAWVKGTNVVPGGRFKAVIQYLDGSRQNVKFPVPVGTYAYRLLDNSREITGDVDWIKLKISTKSSSGRFFVDDVRLVAISSSTGRWLPLPVGG
jgi:hypothetical protein